MLHVFGGDKILVNLTVKIEKSKIISKTDFIFYFFLIKIVFLGWVVDYSSHFE